MKTININTVRAFIKAVNQHNPSNISDLMTEDHTFIDSGGKTESGRKKIIVGWKEYFKIFPDYKIEIEKILANDEIVAVFGSASGTYDGKRGLVPENRIEMPSAWKVVVKNGKVKLWQVYADWTEGTRIIEKDENTFDH